MATRKLAAKKTKTTTTEPETVHIPPVEKGAATFVLLGGAPMVFEAFSLKAQQELLMPPLKKDDAAKRATLKHYPLEEYRNSVYYARDKDSPTVLVQRAASFKKAMEEATLDMPGVAKTQVQRMVTVIGDQVPIYGIPQMFMRYVRLGDLKRTPDIRTRAILPRWCCTITIEWSEPTFNVQAIGALLHSAGLWRGIGGWRVQKGGTYGRFDIVTKDHPEYKELIKSGGEQEQAEALENPIFYDSETEDLFAYWTEQAKERGKKDKQRKAS